MRSLPFEKYPIHAWTPAALAVAIWAGVGSHQESTAKIIPSPSCKLVHDDVVAVVVPATVHHVVDGRAVGVVVAAGETGGRAVDGTGDLLWRAGVHRRHQSPPVLPHGTLRSDLGPERMGESTGAHSG